MNIKIRVIDLSFPMPISSYCRTTGLMLLLCGLLLISESANAYCVYNASSQTIEVTTKDDGKTLRTHTLNPYDGAYEDEKDDNGDYKCANYNDLNLAQTHIITVNASTSEWICILAMQAGGYNFVYDRSRAALAIGTASAPPSDLYCRSYDHDDALRDDSRPTGYDGNSLEPSDRNVRFLVTADPQYIGNDDDFKDIWNDSADKVLETMVGIMNSSDARGILIAGDLTQNAKDSELEMYTDATAGIRRFFFDGYGNHHPDEVEKLDLNTIKRNTVLTARSGPHYSWDWQDVHFVQLNLFPGDVPNGNQGDKDPMFAYAFLLFDLAAFVGDSGRPVVLIHHYGFDSFSTGISNPNEVWWTDEQRDLYLDYLQYYNVIAMFTGHTHLQKSHTSWALDVSGCGTRGSCKDFIAGAARGDQGDKDANPVVMASGEGVFLDVEINHCNEMIVTRKDKYGNAISGSAQQEIVEFDAPGNINEACNTPPVAVAVDPVVGSYSGTEGTAITFDGSSSYDDDGDSLEYRWDFDGDGNWDTGWSSSPTETHTWYDDYTGTVKLQVRDSSVFQAVAEDSTTVSVTNVAPVITSVSGDAIDEDGAATVIGTFSDAGTDDSFTVTIDWGEGSPVDYSYPAGSTGFSETHQYLDDNPGNTAWDDYTVSVTLADDDGENDTDATTVTVNNLSPVIASLSGDAIDENGTAAVSGTFSDTGTEDSFIVTIDWGDGSPVDYSYPAGSTGFSETHQYLDDNPTNTSSDLYSIGVNVTDDDGGSDSGSTTVTVNNLDPVISSVSGDHINEDGTATVSGIFSDTGSQDSFTVTIDWGEGSPVDYSYPAGSTGFSETHQYLDDNPGNTASDVYSIGVAVSDDDGGSDSDSTTVTVNNLDPVIGSLSGDSIDENGTATVSGIFSDIGSQDSFTVTIDWGEGSPVDYSYPAGSTGFSESHQYLDDNPTNTALDVYSIEVTVTDDDLGNDSDSTTVTVNNVTPVAAIDSVVDQTTGLDIAYIHNGTTTVPGSIDVVLVGTTIEVTGSYTDVGSQDLHYLPKPPGAPYPSIDWDDGNVEDVLVSGSGVNGSGAYGTTDVANHSYTTDLAPGIYTIALTVTDDDTGSDTPTAEIEIVDASGALEDALGDLRTEIDAGGLAPEAETLLLKSLDKIAGNSVARDGDAENGALNHLERGNLVPALVAIRQAILYLQDAEAADGSLGLTATKAQLALTAKSIVQDAINRASETAAKSNESRKIADAEELMANGDEDLLTGDYVGALDAYIDAVRAVASIVNP